MVYRMIFNQTAYFGRGAIKEIPAVAKQHGFTKHLSSPTGAAGDRHRREGHQGSG